MAIVCLCSVNICLIPGKKAFHTDMNTKLKQKLFLQFGGVFLKGLALSLWHCLGEWNPQKAEPDGEKLGHGPCRPGRGPEALCDSRGSLPSHQEQVSFLCHLFAQGLLGYRHEPSMAK